jgi:hypothetical protein
MSGCHRTTYNDAVAPELSAWVVNQETLDRFALLIITRCREVITDFDGVENFEQQLNPRSVRWECDAELRDYFGLEE